MILVVDRDPDTRSILRSILEWRGYEVGEASDAEAGLRVMETVAPGLAILEHPLPVDGGPTLLHAVRARPGAASLPIVVLTTSGAPETTREAMEIGCDRVVLKPFAPSRFVEEISRLLAARGSLRAGPVPPAIPAPPADPARTRAEDRATHPHGRKVRGPMDATERERDPQLERMERESFILLQHLYTITEGNPNEWIHCSRMSSDLGLTQAEVRALLAHLGAVELVSSAGESASIRPEGIGYIERLAWRRRSVRK